MEIEKRAVDHRVFIPRGSVERETGFAGTGNAEGQVIKSIWWMPRRQETMKDAVSCEKLRGDASSL